MLVEDYIWGDEFGLEHFQDQMSYLKRNNSVEISHRQFEIQTWISEKSEI